MSSSSGSGPTSRDSSTPIWRGIHHLALVTTDMDATTRFWHGVLGARLVVTLATDAFRHYFFEVAPGSTVAFFEYRDQPVERYAKPAGVPFPQASQFDHLSLGLADEDALHRLRDRLEAHGCEVTDVIDHGIMRSIYFTDPNGIALEASWWTLDATGRPADHADPRFFSDPEPVPAVAEIARAGTVESTPRTELVSEITRDLYKPGATG
ncbi:VOC family protein [Rhabdothermincola sediminis]|uniref:VOC family protein n=1 Tax=Rhabdothermincola sediminis TaxID=2751370 RepID=UPI001AA087D0|nr:VOC family protein [Rhabdothermincola sediminis]